MLTSVDNNHIAIKLAHIFTASDIHYFLTHAGYVLTLYSRWVVGGR